MPSCVSSSALTHPIVVLIDCLKGVSGVVVRAVAVKWAALISMLVAGGTKLVLTPLIITHLALPTANQEARSSQGFNLKGLGRRVT